MPSESVSSLVLDSIAAKRAGASLSATEIRTVVQSFTNGDTPSYQMAAWLATVACCGLDRGELYALTEAYIDSGERVPRLGSGPVADKHSTGGVGDKTSLVVVPLVASCGVSVGKITGRGLGFMGGTVDKLESIPGLRLALTNQELAEHVRDLGLAITGQSASLVPADGATYALRDVTGTVDSVPLIAASIMSKKIAAGCDAVVLDVKFGAGAVLPDFDDARELSRTMVDLGADFGINTVAVLSSMDQPLGHAIGNALEVREAIEALSGTHVPGLSDLAVVISSHMVAGVEPGLSLEEARERVEASLREGRALAYFRRLVEAQSGDVRVVDDVTNLDVASCRTPVLARRAGHVERVAARDLGEVCLGLGAGRLTYDAAVDLGVGVVTARRVGDAVAEGDLLATIHTRDEVDDGVVTAVRDCFSVSDREVAPAPLVREVVAQDG